MIDIVKEYDMINNIVNKISLNRTTTTEVNDVEETTIETLSYRIKETTITVDEEDITLYSVVMKINNEEFEIDSKEMNKINTITNIAYNSIVQYEKLEEGK